MSVHTWRRSDWPEPVGVVRHAPQYTPITSTWEGRTFDWTLVEVDELELGRRATLWLLQGIGLGTILLPNMDLGDKRFHLVLGSEFMPWRAPPVITKLKLALLGEIPDGISDQKVLELLVQQALAR